MFDKWLKLPAHYYLKITALVILTVGICLHNTLMSIATIWLGANWLIEAKYKYYWDKFKSSPAVWFLIALLLFSFISLAWSDDLNYGLKDIGKKMPFFVIPFVLGTSEPIEKKVVHFLCYLLIGILLLTSGINYYRFHFVLENAIDPREMSYFISHIRFAIIVVLGIAVSIYLIFNKKGPVVIWAIAIIWLCYYSFISHVLTAYVLLFTLLLFSILYWTHQKNNRLLTIVIYGLLTASIIAVTIGLNAAYKSFKKPVNVELADLEKETVNGRKYYHNLSNTERENGELVWIYMQQEELESEWNNRSVIDYDSTDRAGQPMFGTLMRYLTSKGLRKDSLAIWSLTEKEIDEIENGKTSYVQSTGLKSKLHEFFMQWDAYQNGGDINGQSVLQRIEHLRIGFELLKSNWIYGVGIGDVHQAFQLKYTEMNSSLNEENRHRSHNQFLTYWISHGILGLMCILGLLLAPIQSVKNKGFIFWSIFITLCLSMLFQDLLETQAGVCVFGFFYSIMAFQGPDRPPVWKKKE